MGEGPTEAEADATGAAGGDAGHTRSSSPHEGGAALVVAADCSPGVSKPLESSAVSRPGSRNCAALILRRGVGLGGAPPVGGSPALPPAAGPWANWCPAWPSVPPSPVISPAWIADSGLPGGAWGRLGRCCVGYACLHGCPVAGDCRPPGPLARVIILSTCAL